MAHFYVLPHGEKVSTMKDARSILGVGTHKFRKLVKDGIVVKVEGSLNETLIAQGDEKQNNLR